MTHLVTDGSDFLGDLIALELLARGHDIARTSKSALWLLKRVS
jgi:nucleoside-diphosphate-sugar epimerase